MSERLPTAQTMNDTKGSDAYTDALEKQRRMEREQGEPPSSGHRHRDYSTEVQLSDKEKIHKETQFRYHLTSPVTDARGNQHPSRHWIKWFPWYDALKRIPGMGRLFLIIEYDYLVPKAVDLLINSRSNIFTLDILAFDLTAAQRADYKSMTIQQIWADWERLGWNPSEWLREDYVTSKGGPKGPCMRYLTIANTEGVVVRFDMKYLKAKFHIHLKVFLHQSQNIFIVYDIQKMKNAWTNLLKGQDANHRFPKGNVIDIQLYLATMTPAESVSQHDILHRYLNQTVSRRFQLKDLEVLMARDVVTETKDPSSPAAEAFIDTLEYCGAIAQLHDVLVAFHQRFDNVASDINEPEAYWIHMFQAIRSVHPQCTSIATDHPRTTNQETRTAIEVREWETMKQLYQNWAGCAVANCQQTSCFFTYYSTQTVRPLLISQQMLAQPNHPAAIWEIPEGIQQQYDQWFKDADGPRHKIIPTTNAPVNDPYLVPNEIFTPGYCALKTMMSNERLWFMEQAEVNRCKATDITHNSDGLRNPTPCYRFKATDITEEIPWQWTAEGVRQDMRDEHQRQNSQEGNKKPYVKYIPGPGPRLTGMLYIATEYLSKATLTELLQRRAALEVEIQSKRLDLNRKRMHIAKCEMTLQRNQDDLRSSQATQSTLLDQEAIYKLKRGQQLETLTRDIETKRDRLNIKRHNRTTVTPETELKDVEESQRINADEDVYKHEMRMFKENMKQQEVYKLRVEAWRNEILAESARLQEELSTLIVTTEELHEFIPTLLTDMENVVKAIDNVTQAPAPQAQQAPPTVRLQQMPRKTNQVPPKNVNDNRAHGKPTAQSLQVKIEQPTARQAQEPVNDAVNSELVRTSTPNNRTVTQVAPVTPVQISLPSTPSGSSGYTPPESTDSTSPASSLYASALTDVREERESDLDSVKQEHGSQSSTGTVQQAVLLQPIKSETIATAQDVTSVPRPVNPSMTVQRREVGQGHPVYNNPDHLACTMATHQQYRADTYIRQLEGVICSQRSAATGIINKVEQLAISDPEVILALISDRDRVLQRWMQLYAVDDERKEPAPVSTMQDFFKSLTAPPFGQQARKDLESQDDANRQRLRGSLATILSPTNECISKWNELVTMQSEYRTYRHVLAVQTGMLDPFTMEAATPSPIIATPSPIISTPGTTPSNTPDITNVLSLAEDQGQSTICPPPTDSVQPATSTTTHHAEQQSTPRSSSTTNKPDGSKKEVVDAKSVNNEKGDTPRVATEESSSLNSEPESPVASQKWSEMMEAVSYGDQVRNLMTPKKYITPKRKPRVPPKKLSPAELRRSVELHAQHDEPTKQYQRSWPRFQLDLNNLRAEDNEPHSYIQDRAQPHWRPVVVEHEYPWSYGSKDPYELRLDVYVTSIVPVLEPKRQHTLTVNMKKALRQLNDSLKGGNPFGRLTDYLYKVHLREPLLRDLIRNKTYPDIKPYEYDYLIFYAASELKRQAINNMRLPMDQYHHPDSLLVFIMGQQRILDAIADKVEAEEGNGMNTEFQKRILEHPVINEEEQRIVDQAISWTQRLSHLADPAERERQTAQVSDILDATQRIYKQLQPNIVRTIQTARKMAEEDKRQAGIQRSRTGTPKKVGQ